MRAAVLALVLLAQVDVGGVQKAIRRLKPWMAPARAKLYARIIASEAPRRAIDPLLVVSFIQSETAGGWNERLVSRTADYGLTQVHVAPRGSARFLGRERELFDPRTNVREWVRLAAMWRAYHERACEPGAHLWWAHLKWGYVIKDPETGYKVLQIYEWLKGEPSS